MSEPQQDRIADLQRSKRKWKFTSAILGAALAGVALYAALLLKVHEYSSLTRHQADEEAQMKLKLALDRLRWENQDLVDENRALRAKLAGLPPDLDRR